MNPQPGTWVWFQDWHGIMIAKVLPPLHEGEFANRFVRLLVVQRETRIPVTAICAKVSEI